MSILILGMEMPTSCWDCYFQDCGNCRLNAHKVVDKCIIEDRRDDNCPLVPVPPHGDLIDRDKFRETMFIGEQCLYSWDEIEDAIDYAPTIIPASEEVE